METQALLIVGVASVNAAVAGLWPRVAYRIAVPADAPVRCGCERCGRRFPAGWRGWLRIGRTCPARCKSFVIHGWVVSVLTAGAAAMLAWRVPAADTAHLLLLLAWLVVVQAGVLLSLVDLAVHRLPTAWIFWLGLVVAACIGAAAVVADQPRWAVSAVIAAVVLGGVYLLLALLTPSGLGMGDVRLATVLVALLGVHGWIPAVAGAAMPYLLALPVAIARLARTAPGGGGQLPFGPFLIGGAVVAAVLVGI